MPDTEERGLVVVDETTKREIDDFSSWAMSIEVHNAEEKAAVLDVIREARLAEAAQTLRLCHLQAGADSGDRVDACDGASVGE